jgi:hypothetical protein
LYYRSDIIAFQKAQETRRREGDAGLYLGFGDQEPEPSYEEEEEQTTSPASRIVRSPLRRSPIRSPHSPSKLRTSSPAYKMKPSSPIRAHSIATISPKSPSKSSPRISTPKSPRSSTPNRQKVITETTITKTSGTGISEKVEQAEIQHIEDIPETKPSDPAQNVVVHVPTVRQEKGPFNSSFVLDKVNEVVDAIKQKLLASPSSPNGSVVTVVTQQGHIIREISPTRDIVTSMNQGLQPFWNNAIRDLLLKLVRKYLFDFAKIAQSVRRNLREKYQRANERNAILVPISSKKGIQSDTLITVNVECYTEKVCREEYARIMNLLEKVIETSVNVDNKKVRQVVKASWKPPVRDFWNEAAPLL